MVQQHLQRGRHRRVPGVRRVRPSAIRHQRQERLARQHQPLLQCCRCRRAALRGARATGAHPAVTLRGAGAQRVPGKHADTERVDPLLVVRRRRDLPGAPAHQGADRVGRRRGAHFQHRQRSGRGQRVQARCFAQQQSDAIRGVHRQHRVFRHPARRGRALPSAGLCARRLRLDQGRLGIRGIPLHRRSHQLQVQRRDGLLTSGHARGGRRGRGAKRGVVPYWQHQHRRQLRDARVSIPGPLRRKPVSGRDDRLLRGRPIDIGRLCDRLERAGFHRRGVDQPAERADR